MRKRTFNINVRVTESEKKRLMRTAKRCGLSLSEYLRKVGLNKKLSDKPNEKLYEVSQICSTVQIAEVNCGIIPTLTTRIFTILVVPITKRIHVGIVILDTISEQMQLSRL